MATRLSDRTETGAGFQLTIRSGSVSAKVEKAVIAGLRNVARQYAEEVDKAISLDDHTLQELRTLGYPYAVAGSGTGLHGTDSLVHEQTGKLRQSIKQWPPEETTSRRFTVYVTSDVPYLPFLLYGTATMRPRPFHVWAYEHIKDKFWQPVLDELAKVEHKVSPVLHLGQQ
jgi:hypothetical protein